MNPITLKSFSDELEKISVSSVSNEVTDRLHREANIFESLGRKMRNLGYAGGALALGSSFIPGIRNRNIPRRILRAGALGGGLVGYFGEQGLRSAAGYRAAAEHLSTGKFPKEKYPSPVIFSPAAYTEAMHKGIAMHLKGKKK